MRDNVYEVVKNREIAGGIFEMILRGDTAEITRPGQFINLAVGCGYLRRPISISDWDDETLTVVYKVVGKGTEEMSRMKEGERICALSPLGNGFDTEIIPEDAVVLGGGMGVAPMYGLAKHLKKEGKKFSVMLGFSGEEDVFYREKFEELGVCCKTISGGYVTDHVAKGSYIAACGPLGMLKAAYSKASDGQLSFEAKMACGFGVCMGCTCKENFGSKKVCTDGPVFRKEEILWQI